MELSQLRSLVAAPMAALFAVLTLCVIEFESRPSTGIKFPLLNLRHHTDQISCDGRWVFIQLLDDGKTKINSDEIPEGDLALQVGNIMKSRVERVDYVVPSSGIPYSRFMETLSNLRKAAPDMHIGVLSGKVGEAYLKPRLLTPNRREPPYEPCDLE